MPPPGTAARNARVPEVAFPSGKRYVNPSVDPGKVISMRKSMLLCYPDPEPKPAIFLEGPGVQWVYDTETARDQDMAALAAASIPAHVPAPRPPDPPRRPGREET